MYKIIYTKRAAKDIQKIKSTHLDKKAKALIELIKKNPFQTPPPYEKLLGNLQDLYSRRINVQHRLVYQVDDKRNEVKIVSLWSHYENL